MTRPLPLHPPPSQVKLENHDAGGTHIERFDLDAGNEDIVVESVATDDIDYIAHAHEEQKLQAAESAAALHQRSLGAIERRRAAALERERAACRAKQEAIAAAEAIVRAKREKADETVSSWHHALPCVAPRPCHPSTLPLNGHALPLCSPGLATLPPSLLMATLPPPCNPFAQMETVFSNAGRELHRALDRRRKQVGQQYGIMAKSGVRFGVREGGLELWKHQPQPASVYVDVLRAVRDKLPSGRYSVHVSVFTRLGGHALASSAAGFGAASSSVKTGPQQHSGPPTSRPILP